MPFLQDLTIDEKIAIHKHLAEEFRKMKCYRLAKEEDEEAEKLELFKKYEKKD